MWVGVKGLEWVDFYEKYDVLRWTKLFCKIKYRLSSNLGIPLTFVLFLQEWLNFEQRRLRPLRVPLGAMIGLNHYLVHSFLSSSRDGT